MQVKHIWETSRIEECLQGEGFTEKATFKLTLKGRIDFVRQISYIGILAKFFYHIHFAKHSAVHLIFLCNISLSS